LSICANGNTLSASDSRPTPRRAKSDFLSVVPKAISYQSVSTALRDELGLEYLRQTVANDVDEANVLQAFSDINRERLAKTSHNLKSVSGLIGMQETGALAAKIQDDCLNWQHDDLKDTVEKLQQVAANESQEVRKIASTLPER
jgi:HPt (histidine-containing phosphotransfer) domain-containing protein